MEAGADLAPTKEAIRPETYMVEGAKVQLRWTETSPKESKNLDPKRAIVFIPAWNWLPEVQIVKDISQKVADHSGQRVYTVSSKTDQLGPNSRLTEAKGMAQFLAKHNLSEIIVIGHSEGGLKATDLVATLEKSSPQTVIDGLVLMDSMGLYEQESKMLRKNFINDPIKIAPKEFKDTGVTPPPMRESATQLLYGIWQDLKFFGKNYPKKLKEEIAAMAQLNPRLQEIKAPVLIITGERDYVSDHRKYVPEEEINNRVDPALSNQSKQGQMFKRGKARREYLRESILPSVENVAMIVLSKGSHHSGSTDIRINQVAHVASKIFERMRRPANAS